MTAAAAPATAPRRTPALGAFLEGWRRSLRAPALAISVVAIVTLAGLPLAGLLNVPTRRYLGAVDESLPAAGPLSRLGPRANDLPRTFADEMLGWGGAMTPLGPPFHDAPITAPLFAATVVYVAVSLFLAGGAIDRLARGRPLRLPSFLAVCGACFWRFVRLAILSGVVSVSLLHWLRPRLVTLWNDRVGAWPLVPHAIVFALLMAVTVIVDYARVRAVVEDRRSMLGAIGASWRFVRSRLIRVAAIYGLDAVAVLAILRLWYQAAPAVTSTRAPIVIILGVLYALCRTWIRLALIAAQATFFQGELAHAGYTAAPEPQWPDSPAIEAIRNLKRP